MHYSHHDGALDELAHYIMNLEDCRKNITVTTNPPARDSDVPADDWNHDDVRRAYQASIPIKRSNLPSGGSSLPVQSKKAVGYIKDPQSRAMFKSNSNAQTHTKKSRFLNVKWVEKKSGSGTRDADPWSVIKVVAVDWSCISQDNPAVSVIQESANQLWPGQDLAQESVQRLGLSFGYIVDKRLTKYRVDCARIPGTLTKDEFGKTLHSNGDEVFMFKAPRVADPFTPVKAKRVTKKRKLKSPSPSASPTPSASPEVNYSLYDSDIVRPSLKQWNQGY
jgi:hypothetical protein